ncbi:MAG: SLC13 family permease [Peptococcaceae bacterium]|nr:SLC13 family permease [Peptococcaceae bacterium]
MAEKEKVHWTYWMHLAIGGFFMFGFPMLDPIEPLTEIGMTVLGVFIGMVYLWSAVDSIWPSMLGLMLVAMAGYVSNATGYAAVKQLWMEAFGAETVIVCLLGLVLFGAVEYVGCTKYMARFFMSIKALEGRPYIFLFIFFLCSYVIGGTTNPMASMLILWPIALEVLEKFGYKKGDSIFAVMICGVYLASTLGQPMFPFKGASYVVVSAFEKMSSLTVNYGAYIAYNVIMSILLLTLFLVFVRFVIRPNVDGFKNITVEELTKEKLEPMNIQQIAFLLMIVVYVALLLIPNFLPKTIPFVAFLSSIGLLGLTCFIMIILMVIPYKGKPMLDFKGVAKKSFSWDIVFLVTGALYVCNALSSEVTGVKPFLIQLLQPLLGGKPEIVFILLILGFALLTTNFANNAGMAVVLLPVIIAFADQYPGVDPLVLSMTVTMMVFVTLLTPAASPYCGILHARRDLVSYGEILKLFIPMAVIALLTYAFVGFRIANILF